MKREALLGEDCLIGKTYTAEQGLVGDIYEVSKAYLLYLS